MHGFVSWQVCENDHGGFKKLMWHGMMKEFSCKATSTLSKCASERKWISRTDIVEKKQE